MSAYTPLVSVRNVSKSFPGGIQALYNISLDVYPGEVLAILGENGSGKSTLVKILYGIYVPDEGELYVNGKRAYIKSPRDAIKHGIVLISQMPQLIESLSTVENILLSLQESGLFTTKKRALEQIKKVSREFGIKVDPDLKVYALTYTQRQLVEILKAILLNARVLMIDEALTYMPESGRRELYKFILDFKSKGNSVVLVTHKIPEALEVADRLAILRRGVLVDVLTREEATVEKIRLLMFGSDLNTTLSIKEKREAQLPVGKDVVSVKDLVVLGDYGEEAVKKVTFSVKAGEVVSVTGLTGNGQRELVEAVVGVRKIFRGKVYVDGVDVTNRGSSVVRDLGVGFIPDTPLKYGVAIDMSIVENTALLLSKKRLIPEWDLIKKITLEIINNYNIVTRSEETPVKMLSGGNLMKVVIGRELQYARKALIAYNPTRNLDEYTSNIVKSYIAKKAREEGLAVLYVTEDLDEALHVGDSLYVMSSGTLHGPFKGGVTERSVIERFMVV